MGSVERIFVGLFGLLLLGVGVYAMFVPGLHAAWRYGGGLAFLVLGANAVLGAYTGKRPWIARIGPLP